MWAWRGTPQPFRHGFRTLFGLAHKYTFTELQKMSAFAQQVQYSRPRVPYFPAMVGPSTLCSILP